MMRNKFTNAQHFLPVVTGPHIGSWQSAQGFQFYERDDKTGPFITICKGDISNGADVPPPLLMFLVGFVPADLAYFGFTGAVMTGLLVAALCAWLFPRVHAEYIAAVFVHDIGLTDHRDQFSRARIDRMFLRAMQIERWPLARMPPLSEHRAFARWLTRSLPAWAWRMVRPWLMYFGVAVWGLIKERGQYFKTVSQVKGE